MIHPRRTLQFSWAVLGLVVALLAWWVYFFSRQGEFLVSRLERAGSALTPAQQDAIRAAARESMRMFLFEGGFLGLCLLASVYLVVRSLQRELELHRQQKNFLSAVTHELCSPLASARLYVESLLLGRAEGEKRERYLRHAQEDLDRLRARVDQLLETARMTSAGPLLRLEPLDLAGFSARTVEQLAGGAELSRASIEVDAPAPVPVRADSAALETILGNLLSNAVKYGGEEPRVKVSVRAQGREALLEVRDWGPGLLGANGREIFQPFVRGEEHAAQARPGVGLGLYLVAELARALGGRVRAQDQLQGGGTLFEVALPLVVEEA